MEKMIRFSKHLPVLPVLAVGCAFGLYQCQITQESQCDPCTAAIVVKIVNLSQLASGALVFGKLSGSSVFQPVEYDTASDLFKIAGGPGRYTVTIRANGDSAELSDTLVVEESESKGCKTNNTLNLDVEVKASAIGIDRIETRALVKSPRC